MSIGDNPSQQQKMVRVYKLRIHRANEDVRRQIVEVKETEKELSNRLEKVNGMKGKLEESFAFMAKLKRAEDIVSANTYNAWMKDDIERESFYVEMTREELQEKTIELKRRQSVVVKLEKKRDAIIDLGKKYRIQRDVMAEIYTDDESHKSSQWVSI